MILNTQRTEIKPISKKDIPSIVKMYHEPDSNKYIEPLQGKTDEEYAEFLSRKIEENKKQIGFWCVYHKKKRRVHGNGKFEYFSTLEYYAYWMPFKY